MPDIQDIQNLLYELSSSNPDNRFEAVKSIRRWISKRKEEEIDCSTIDIEKELINALSKETDSLVRQFIKKVIIGDKKYEVRDDPKVEPVWEGINVTNPPTVRSLFLEAFKKSSGEIFDAFCEIAVNSHEYEEFLSEAFKRFRFKCPLHPQVSCSHIILKTNEIFVAHTFNIEMKDDLRKAIDEAIRKALPEYNSYYADQEITSGDMFCKICQKIQGSKFAIFEVSEGCNACKRANSNVTLELGIAYGVGKRAFLISRMGSGRLADIARQDSLEYQSYKDLEKKLVHHLPTWSNHNSLMKREQLI